MQAAADAPPGPGAQRWTRAEVALHDKEGDAWIIVGNDVFDVSSFAKFHPGGRVVLQEQAGKDATELFKRFHSDAVFQRYRERLLVGVLAESDADAREATRKQLVESMLPDSFGDMVPYGDPAWYQRLNSPYYKETHRRFRAKVRAFVEREIAPTYEEWAGSAEPPAELLLKMGQAGLLACMVGRPFPADYVDAGVEAPEDFDTFHELILYDELSRLGSAVVLGALTNGPSIAVTAILRFGTEEQKRQAAPDVLMGRACAALAISEPNAGSDVAGLLCQAIRRPDGSWVVNGNKKWITNGTYAEWFVVCCVTDTTVKDPRRGGMSFFLIHRDTPGFSQRKVNVRGTAATGTAYLDFDECVIPASALLGEEGNGFRQTMHNFNHERFYLACCCARLSRVCLEESVKYSMKRETFGKKLYQHQAIRMKLAHMMRLVEQLQAWIELVAYQMCTMTHDEAQMKIGDITGLLKVQSSKVYELCARETTQIFGGNALYIGGVGSKIEVAVNQVKAYQIPGGAEDILDDYAARAAIKLAQRMARL